VHNIPNSQKLSVLNYLWWIWLNENIYPAKPDTITSGGRKQLSIESQKNWSSVTSDRMTFTVHHHSYSLTGHPYDTPRRIEGIYTGNIKRRTKSSRLKSLSMAHLAVWSPSMNFYG